MDLLRRRLLQRGLVVAAASELPLAFGAPRARSSALPQGLSDFCVYLSPLAGAEGTITDYSGFSYCESVNALLLFGGGHAATPEDVVLRFPMDTLAWSADYVATPTPVMKESDAGGKLKHRTAGNFWQVPGQVPALRPVSRHTYTGFIWSSAIQRMLLMVVNNGVSYGFPAETQGGNIAEYDPIARTWHDTGCVASKATHAFCEDPVSGNVLAMDAGGLRVYDPRSRQWVRGSGGGLPRVTNSENLVYFPPNDRFYYFAKQATTINGAPVIEFALDRSTLAPLYTLAGAAPLETNWRPLAAAGGSRTRYVYDDVNELIVGGMHSGAMYGFSPLGDGKGRWAEHPVEGVRSQTRAYCHAYVRAIDTHLFIVTLPGRVQGTYGFRWNKAKARPVADTRPRPTTGLPEAAIQAGAVVCTTLQQACDVGGDIRLGYGRLLDGAATAHVRKPCRIVGQGTALFASGIQGKGILVVDADLHLESVDISGARVSDGNGAAIRHQAGNVTLKKVLLHNCQNGILGPGSTSATEVVMDECHVYENGTGTGQTHGLYIGKISKFSCSNSRFDSTSIGHHLKSRAMVSIVNDCELGTSFTGNESYNLDFQNGGLVTIERCVLRQGADTDNSVMLNFGDPDKVLWDDNALLVQGCTFVSRRGGVGIRNLIPTVVADVRDCNFIGVATPISGRHTRRNCKLNDRPLPDILVG